MLGWNNMSWKIRTIHMLLVVIHLFFITPSKPFEVIVVRTPFALFLVVFLTSPSLGPRLGAFSSWHIRSCHTQSSSRRGIRVELHLGTQTILFFAMFFFLQTLMTPSTLLLAVEFELSSQLTPSTIVLLPELVTDLSSTLSSSELPALLVSRIQITPYYTLVQLCS